LGVGCSKSRHCDQSRDSALPSTRQVLTGEISRGGQRQVGVFFAADGTQIIVPEPSRFFEAPITALPEDFFYIP
jgi:hypothetical protein